MADPFARLSQSVLARFGQDAFLRGSADPCRVAIERNLEASDPRGYQHHYDVQYGQLTDKRIAAWIPVGLAPATGDALRTDGIDYRLDSLVDEDEAMRCFLLVQA